MGVTRKEKLLKAMLNDNAEACRGGVTREERIIASVSKKVCDNDALEGGGSGSGGNTGGGMPEGGNPHQMLVTDGDGNAKWDARTHYYSSNETHVINYDDNNENNVTLPDGRIAYYVDGLSWEDNLNGSYLLQGRMAEYMYGEIRLSSTEVEIEVGSEVTSYTYGNMPGGSFEIRLYFAEFDDQELDGVVFPKAGIYAVKGIETEWMGLTWNAWLYDIHDRRTVAKYLSEDFIPDNIKLPATNGEPHQMLVTDEDGTPKWEDRSTTGGGGVVFIDATVIDEDMNCQLSHTYQEITELYSNKNYMVAVVNMGEAITFVPLVSYASGYFNFAVITNDATLILQVGEDMACLTFQVAE